MESYRIELANKIHNGHAVGNLYLVRNGNNTVGTFLTRDAALRFISECAPECHAMGEGITIQHQRHCHKYQFI